MHTHTHRINLNYSTNFYTNYRYRDVENHSAVNIYWAAGNGTSGEIYLDVAQQDRPDALRHFATRRGTGVKNCVALYTALEF